MLVFRRLHLLLATQTLVGNVPLLSRALSLALLGSIMVDLLANLDDLLNAIILRPIIIGGDLTRENLGHALLILDPIASLSWGLTLVDYCAVLANKTPAIIQIFETVYKKR